MNKTERIISIVFMIIGAICLTIGVWKVIDYYTREEVDAIVTLTELQYDDEGTVLVYYEYEYEVDGVTYLGKSNGSVSYNIAPKEGEWIKIRIKKGNPSDADDAIFLWWMLTAFGALAGLGGVLIFRKSQNDDDVLQYRNY